MSERYGTGYPDDEPVIGGGGFAPPSAPLIPPGLPHYIGGTVETEYDEPEIGAHSNGYSENGYSENGYAEDEYAEDDEYYEEEDDEYGYYEDDYDAESPARQPMFYVFVALAALVGGIVVFLLFSLVNNDNKDGGGGGGSTSFAVKIDSPPKDKRIEIGKSEEVIVQASATESISLFELFVGDRLADSVNVTETPPDNKYRATLKYTLPARGNYDLMVKVTSSSGATKESDKVRVIAIEPVGERPQTIRGKVVADTTLRSGPGDSYPEVGTLKAGEEVTILGKSKQIDWLLIDTAQGQKWAKRTAIDPLDSLDLVPQRDVTPTPAPTQEPTRTTIPSPSPSASASPTANPNAPDFVPTNAILLEGGARLRVTLQNVSTNAYNGPLTIEVSGDVGSKELAIAANVPGNGGTATVEFDLGTPITTAGKKAVVSVDPKNAVKESREDNNGATFVLLPPEVAPEINILAPTVTPSNIAITIKNDGGPMTATNVTVRVKVGTAENSESKNIALATGQSQTFSVSNPGAGQATAEVVINGEVVASANFTIGP
jgi:hypothetical protein